MPLTRAPNADASTPVPLPPAPRRTPVLETSTGLVTRAWATWFDLLWKRSGEAHAPSNAELDEGMTDNESALAALQAELDATQAELAATQAALAATQAELAATQAELDTTQTELDQTQLDLAATQAAQAATQAELDATQTQLASDLPPGTAFTVARYQSDGVGVESSPLLVDTPGNLRLGTVTPGTSATRVVAVASGVAPSAAHPADAVQLWVEDQEAVAGLAALHVRSESGVLTKIGTGVLSRVVVLVLSTQTVAAPYLATVEESGKLFLANNASAMVQVTLPLAVVGLVFECVVLRVQGLLVRANTADNIRLEGTIGADAGGLQSTTIGNYLRLVATNATTWQVMSPTLGWTAVA